MSHNPLARPQAFWAATDAHANYIAVPTCRDFALWDTFQYKGLDGDQGGTWAPSKPIAIGGAGLQLSGAGNFLAGGVTTSTGGRLIHGNNDYLVLPNTLRTETLGFLGSQVLTSSNGQLATGTLSTSPFGFVTPAGWTSLVLPISSRYMHQGAALSKVLVTGRMLAQPASFPTTPLEMFFESSGGTYGFGGSLTPLPYTQWAPTTGYTAGQYVYPLAKTSGFYYRCTISGTSSGTEGTWPTTVGGTFIDGSVTWQCQGYAGLVPYPTTTAGYYAGGVVQTFELSVDAQHNPYTIDCSQNSYSLTNVPDSVGTQWLWHAVQLFYTSITDLRPE